MQRNIDQPRRFDISRLDVCVILLTALIGTVVGCIVFQNLLVGVLIGFNSGAGGGTAAVILLRLAFGRDYLQLERTRNMTNRERLKVLFTLAASFVLAVAGILWSERKHPFVDIAIVGGVLLFCCAMLLYGWLHSRLKAKTTDH